MQREPRPTVNASAPDQGVPITGVTLTQESSSCRTAAEAKYPLTTALQLDPVFLTASVSGLSVHLAACQTSTSPLDCDRKDKLTKMKTLMCLSAGQVLCKQCG